jgi:hypothetical protein
VQDAALLAGNALDRVEDILTLAYVALRQPAGAVLPGDDGPVAAIGDEGYVRYRGVRRQALGFPPGPPVIADFLFCVLSALRLARTKIRLW